jgi:glycosyltransferase involved in cell wall biosynthesis/GT2 family glycosyltransferase
VSHPLAICIVTTDIVGPIRNGGIGTAYYNLARALAGAGHRVTVLYTPGAYCEVRTVAHWQRHYRRLGMTFVPLPEAEARAHTAIRVSYGVYQWLKSRRFDIVHCHEWRGVGFYTAQAKRQGLCLEDTVLCVGAHSPTLWHLEGMNELADAEALEVDFMERESVALADVLWTPSRHMQQWMQREGWRLPARVLHQPYILLGVETPAGARPRAQPGSELVFFGRLETRKGLDLFCDALDRLVAAGATVPFVTFLGKLASVGGVPSEEYLQARSARWPFRWQMLGTRDRDAAMAYLQEPNRVAILPSKIDNLPYTVLECLGGGIPFLAASTGGIPEMVRTRDRARVLFAPTAEALAARLSSVLGSGHRSVPPRVRADRTHANWLRWHDRQARPRARRARAERQRAALPTVTVCLTHHNRPTLLGAALASIRRQDYPRLDVVLVDDGSDRADAVRCLAGLEDEFQNRGWTIVRQPNRYPGAARNAAVAAARGDYLLFMDDDNLAMPHEVSTLVGAARASGADILTCFLSVFQGATPESEGPPLYTWPFLGAALAPGLLRNVFGDANALVRRDVFERVGGFTEDFGVGCEDWEFFARAVLRGLRLEVVPEPLVFYRQSARGITHSTPDRANRMRALRPYLGLLPAQLRPLVHLAHAESGVGSSAPAAARLDHVRQAVVFGTGSAGRLALDLAARCGWTVPWLVDNNPATWNTTAHGLPVRAPHALTADPADLVIVASVAGKARIASQLEGMGLVSGQQFVHFLDPVRRGNLVTRVQL